MFVTVVVAAEEDDTETKECLALTFVSSEQSDFSHDNLSSHYHNITSLRVPIAEAESDFDTADNEDENDEDDEDEEMSDEKEEEEKNFRVSVIFFSSSLKLTDVKPSIN